MTVALLGSTGKTGRVVLRSLLYQDSQNLQIYVRSKDKLVTLFPKIESNPRVKIITGPIHDQDVIQKCLSGASIIICTLGNREFSCETILHDSASSIITALSALKQGNDRWQIPRMIYLSSASENVRFAATRPRLVDWLIQAAFRTNYDDLHAAESVLLADPSLVSVLRVQPPMLVEESATGFEISIESVKLAVSYEDLGHAFVELAFEHSYDEIHQVGVSSLQGNRAARYAPKMLYNLSFGLFVTLFPGASAIRQGLSQLF